MQRKDIRNVLTKDISEKMEFSRVGYDYKNIVFDADHHCGIWKMTKNVGGIFKDMGYEVVKGHKYKNPDGSIVYRYPSDEKFGVNGFYTFDFDKCKKILDSWCTIKD